MKPTAELRESASLSTTGRTSPEKRRTLWRRWRRAARRRGKLFAGILIVSLFYAVALFADFLAPYDYRAQSRREPMAAPSIVHWRDAQGGWHARPFVYARRLVDPLARRYEEETTRAYPLALFANGYQYRLLGLFPTGRHLFGLQDQAGATAPRVQLLGTDSLGRDRLSRLLLASRFSLLVGPAGTLLASALGILLGCIAGFSGRWVDAVLMRAADAMMALPSLVLILAARAAFPLELPPARAALLMISIFAVVGWAEMARVTRGLVLALRRREFVLAAESIGLSKLRVLFRHILPNAARPLLVQVTLMLPYFLLTETALSFLGIGLQEPEASWGNMLAAAGDINLLRLHTFTLLAPALAIFVFVLGVRLLSDGLSAAGEQRRS
ncbi:MAG TPA: ABC transporter permease [Pyrinomonadaceae bacterium]|jgi:peptide/nickel transport system permease protein